MMIDIKTAFFGVGLASITFALLLSLTTYKSGSKHIITTLTLAKLSLGMACLLLSGRGILPEVVTKNIGNSLLFTGFAIECIAAWVFVGKTRWKEFVLPVLVAAILLMNSPIMATSSEALKVSIASFIVAIFMIQCAAAFLKNRPKISLLSRSIGLIDAIIAAVNVYRGISAILHPEFSLLSQTMIQYLALGSFLVFPFSNGFGFLLLIKENDDVQLKNNEECYRAIFSNSPAINIIFDVKSGEIVDVNKPAADFFGYEMEQLKRMSINDISCLNTEHFFQTLEGLAIPEQGYFTFHHHFSDGSVRDAEAYVSSFNYGDRPMMVTIIHDISERKRSEKSQQLHLTIMETVAEGIFIVGAEDFIIKWTNRKLEKMFGYGIGEMVGMLIDSINAPTGKTPAETRKDILKLMEHNSEWHGEIKNIKKDGTHFWCHAHISVFVHPEFGKVFVAAHTDIDQQKRIAEMLLSSERQYRSLVTSLNDGFFATDDKGFLTYVNESLAKIYGVKTPNNVIGKHISEFIAPIDKERAMQLFFQAVTGHIVPTSIEILTLRHDGNVINTEVKPTILFHKDGTITTQGLLIDITERKSRDNAIRESEEKYRALFHNELYAICIFNVETFRFIDVNDAYVKLYGYSKDELLDAMTIHDITTQHQESDTATQKALSDGTIYIPLRYHKKKDGTIFPVEIVGGPYTLKGEKVMFGIAHDISERTHAEKEIEAALHQKDVLLREVHHRVKNNMQVISSLLNLQSEKSQSEQVRQALNESQQRVISMALIHETLYSGQNIATIDLCSYLEKLVKFLHDAFGEPVNVSTDLVVDRILLDIDHAVPCGLIINELVTNAFKHAFPDGRKGTVKINARKVNRKDLVIDVIDNGIGFRGDLDIDDSTTLGLRLVKGLLKHQLKGTLHITVSEGTTFTLHWSLPVDKGIES